jgi:hypothetical protein
MAHSVAALRVSLSCVDREGSMDIVVTPSSDPKVHDLTDRLGRRVGTILRVPPLAYSIRPEPGGVRDGLGRRTVPTLDRQCRLLRATLRGPASWRAEGNRNDDAARPFPSCAGHPRPCQRCHDGALPSRQAVRQLGSISRASSRVQDQATSFTSRCDATDPLSSRI